MPHQVPDPYSVVHVCPNADFSVAVPRGHPHIIRHSILRLFFRRHDLLHAWHRLNDIQSTISPESSGPQTSDRAGLAPSELADSCRVLPSATGRSIQPIHSLECRRYDYSHQDNWVRQGPGLVVHGPQRLGVSSTSC